MCGIAGLYEREGRIDLARLGHMGQLLRHRGPHDEGVVLIEPGSGHSLALGGADTPLENYQSPVAYAPGRRHGTPAGDYSVALGHRRLSIVDLTPSGHQPMCDVQARLWLVFNGEIYNWVELKAELQAAGETFESKCDSEVIIAAYRLWGEDCLARMNGMFAFAIWDQIRQVLFCARDRFGVKPFFYQWDGRTFAFASEPKAVALTQPNRIVPRLAAIRDLVALDWVDHECATFFVGLEQLPPGHALTVGRHGLTVRRWWTLDPHRRARGGPAEWDRTFEELFTDAVRIRLRADVEVGSCLSGGLDSSAVVTTASRLVERPLHTFTCAYEEGRPWDEREFVAGTVAASGARSHVTVPDGADFWSVFDRLAYQQDEPTAGPGVFSQWKVMELARLWGDVAARLGPSHALALVIEPWLPRGLFEPLRRAYGQGKDRVLAPRLRHLPGHAPPRPPREFHSAVLRQQAFDLLQRLLPSLLRYEDRNSMAFSIETRLPFLDYRLVELAFSLPDDQRISR